MKAMRIAVCLVLVALIGCPPNNSWAGESPLSKANLGKQITVEGWAVDRKIGAQLVGSDFNVWIDGLSSWPKGYYTGGDKGKKVKVTGILAEDHGLPVFIPKKGESPIQGIPVPEGTDVKKASHRYLLKNAKWELLEK
jgi:hypothetical protein